MSLRCLSAVSQQSLSSLSVVPQQSLSYLVILSEHKILRLVKSFSTHLTEYLGAGNSESGKSDGSIMGPGEEEGERSGESGPSVAELRSSG